MFLKKKKDVSLDTRAVIMQTATKLFAEKGFEAVSIRELAKEADVNIAMISYHFGSKDALFKAIIEDKLPKGTAQLLEIQNIEANAWQKISAIIDVYVEKLFTEGTINKLLFRELSLEQRPEHREFITEGISKNWKIITTIIEDGQKKGELKSDIDVSLSVVSMFSTMSMLVNTTCLAAHFLNETDEKMIFTESTKLRVKNHLKSMMKSHLLLPTAQ